MVKDLKRTKSELTSVNGNTWIKMRNRDKKKYEKKPLVAPIYYPRHIFSNLVLNLHKDNT